MNRFPIPQPIQTIPLTGGGNNRLFKLEFNDHPPLVLKQYFQHPHDLRPRLKAEFAFLNYAWNLGLRNIPEPLFASESTNEAYYSFLQGRASSISDITDGTIDQMLTFIQILNQNKRTAIDLPQASESCFSPTDYVQITDKRIQRLHSIPNETSLEKELHTFVANQLLPKWEKLKESTCKAALHCTLAVEDQCITPSDFGFHNILIDSNNALFFIDFEYAGWDDPCKTVCDLFCQPKVPIPEKYFSAVARSISSTTQNPDACLDRIKLFSPVIQMKWCCIILNVFTQVGKNRRAFSHSNEIEKLEKQLLLAKDRLQKIEV